MIESSLTMALVTPGGYVEGKSMGEHSQTQVLAEIKPTTSEPCSTLSTWSTKFT